MTEQIQSTSTDTATTNSTQFDIGAFVDALTILKSGADKIKDASATSGLVFLEGDHMFTFNGDVYCGTNSPFNAPTQIALKYSEIMKVLKGKNGYGTCTFTSDDSKVQIDITGKRAQTTVSIVPDTSIGKMPDLPQADKDKWLALPDPLAFKESIKLAESVYDRLSAGTSLENIHLTKDFMECGSPTQFIRSQCSLPLEEEVLVLGGIMSKITASTSITDIQISADKMWFLLREGATYFALPISTAEYIKNDAMQSLFYPNDPDAIVLEFPDRTYNEEFCDEITRGRAFNDKIVDITLNGTKCDAEFRDSITGSSLRTTIDGVKTNCTGSVKFAIVPEVLVELLQTSVGKMGIHAQTVTIDTGSFAYVVTHFGLI